MKDVTIEDILQVCEGTLICGTKDLICENFSKDTRNIQKGDIYVGIKGENFDGNILYKEAFQKGASACLLQGIELAESDKKEIGNKTVVMVKDTIEAIGKLAAYKRSFYDIPVVAITGSVGKTSTKDIIASVVAQKYKVLKTEGNLNNDIGLPLTILGLKDHEALVIEIGMNHFGEIRYLTNITKPSIAVITNIGTAHIGILGSRENILKAKLEILEGLKQDGICIVNEDNDLLKSFVEQENKVRTKTYGIEEKSDIYPTNIEIGTEKSHYHICINEQKYTVEVPISGKHFVYNSLAAIAVGLELGIDMESIIKGIREFELTKNRMDIQKLPKDIILINDVYNASYDSMKASIEYLKAIQGKRKIAILGDMLELGEYSQELHEKVGEEVAKNKIDVLITVGTEAKYIAQKAEEKGMSAKSMYAFSQNIQVIEFLKIFLQKEDVILLKASKGMKFIEMIEKIEEITGKKEG